MTRASAASWKQEIANRSDDVLSHPLVLGVMEELAGNLGVPFQGLPKYGIAKVAMYAAQVAIAQTLGIDPDLLRMTEAEAGEAALARAAEMVGAGVPVFVVVIE